MAQSWQIGGNGVAITFTLRADARWHNGQPVTTQDVLFSYSLLQNEAFPADPALKRLWQAVEMEAIDDRQIAFRLPAVYAPFLSATTMGILPAEIFGKTNPTDIPQHPFNKAPVGTGAFRLINRDWTESGTLGLGLNPDYWEDTPLLDGILFRFYPDESSLARALADGEVHGVNFVTPEALPAFAGIPDVRLFTVPQTKYSQLLFNLTDNGATSLKQRELRQALALGLDVGGVLADSMNGQGLSFAGTFLPDSWAHNPTISIPYPFNPISCH